MDYYNLFLRFIILIKIIFIGLAIYGIYIEKYESTNKVKFEKIQYFKKRIEIFFKGLMAILLIYLSNNPSK